MNILPAPRGIFGCYIQYEHKIEGVAGTGIGQIGYNKWFEDVHHAILFARDFLEPFYEHYNHT